MELNKVNELSEIKPINDLESYYARASEVSSKSRTLQFALGFGPGWVDPAMEARSKVEGSKLGGTGYVDRKRAEVTARVELELKTWREAIQNYENDGTPIFQSVQGLESSPTNREASEIVAKNVETIVDFRKKMDEKREEGFKKLIEINTKYAGKDFESASQMAEEYLGDEEVLNALDDVYWEDDDNREGYIEYKTMGVLEGLLKSKFDKEEAERVINSNFPNSEENGLFAQKLEERQVDKWLSRQHDSEYWNRDLPGVEGWTVGDLMEQLRETVMPGNRYDHLDSAKVIFDSFNSAKIQASE